MRNFIHTTLLSVISIGMFSLTASCLWNTPTFGKGDLNGNGALGGADLSLLDRHLSGAQPLSDELLPRADANDSGTVTAHDRWILSRLWGNGDLRTHRTFDIATWNLGRADSLEKASQSAFEDLPYIAHVIKDILDRPDILCLQEVTDPNHTHQLLSLLQDGQGYVLPSPQSDPVPILIRRDHTVTTSRKIAVPTDARAIPISVVEVTLAGGGEITVANTYLPAGRQSQARRTVVKAMVQTLQSAGPIRIITGDFNMEYDAGGLDQIVHRLSTGRAALLKTNPVSNDWEFDQDTFKTLLEGGYHDAGLPAGKTWGMPAKDTDLGSSWGSLLNFLARRFLDRRIDYLWIASPTRSPRTFAGIETDVRLRSPSGHMDHDPLTATVLIPR